ncbi:MAG: hypothetical protein AB1420_15895 [Bacillota bacterium]
MRKEKEVMIYENLKPKECYLLYRDTDGIVYVGNRKGRVFIAKALFSKKVIENEEDKENSFSNR